MGSHPINLTVRFLLELLALAAMAFWGWNHGDGLLRLAFAFGVPLVAAALWGTFAVPHDPSRSGQALIAVPGLVRLALEATFFSGAVWALLSAGATTAGGVFASAVLVHYAVSYDRVFWLIHQ
jgi:hypothetical protein